MRSYTSIALGGLLGSIMGGAKAAHEYSVEEQREEAIRVRDDRLSRLRMREYEARADIDIWTAPRKAGAEAQGRAAAEEITRPGVIETRRQIVGLDTDAATSRRRTEKELEGEFMGQDAERAGRLAGATAAATATVQEPYKVADDNRRMDQQIRVIRATAEEARRNNWRMDSEGFYVDGDGQRVSRSERVEGRTVPVFVKAPASKAQGKDWMTLEELDSLNRRIEQAERRAAAALGDEEKAQNEATLQRLLEEKSRLLGRSASQKPEGTGDAPSSTAAATQAPADGPRLEAPAKTVNAVPPSKEEAIGELLDAARQEYADLSDPPGIVEEKRKPGSLNAWRAKRDGLLSRIAALAREYERAMGPGATAYFGGSRGGPTDVASTGQPATRPPLSAFEGPSEKPWERPWKPEPQRVNHQPESSPARPKTQAELEALPPGALWIDPRDGQIYRKP